MTRNEPTFRQIVATGFRTVFADWLALILLFVTLAALLTGACAEILVLRESGRQLPPELIAIAIIGHTSIFWWPIVFFGLPWIIGGAAASYRDELHPPERRSNYAGQANYFYARTFVLLTLFGTVEAMLFTALYALPMWFLFREELFTAERPIVVLTGMMLRPVTLAFTTGVWAMVSVILTVKYQVLAAMVVEDVGLHRAAQRGLSFLRDYPADAARLWAFGTLAGLPSMLLLRTIWHVRPDAKWLAIVGSGTGFCSASAMAVTLAVAVSLFLARWPADPAGSQVDPV